MKAIIFAISLLVSSLSFSLAEPNNRPIIGKVQLDMEGKILSLSEVVTSQLQPWCCRYFVPANSLQPGRYAARGPQLHHLHSSQLRQVGRGRGSQSRPHSGEV